MGEMIEATHSRTQRTGIFRYEVPISKEVIDGFFWKEETAQGVMRHAGPAMDDGREYSVRLFFSQRDNDEDFTKPVTVVACEAIVCLVVFDDAEIGEYVRESAYTPPSQTVLQKPSPKSHKMMRFSRTQIAVPPTETRGDMIVCWKRVE